VLHRVYAVPGTVAIRCQSQWDRARDTAGRAQAGPERSKFDKYEDQWNKISGGVRTD